MCRKLEATGSPRAASEGPIAFSDRLRRSGNPVATLEDLLLRYAGLRYAHAVPDAAAVREFAGAVRALRLPGRFAKIYTKSAAGQR